MAEIPSSCEGAQFVRRHPSSSEDAQFVRTPPSSPGDPPVWRRPPVRQKTSVREKMPASYADVPVVVDAQFLKTFAKEGKVILW
jgi:hypothetical protein